MNEQKHKRSYEEDVEGAPFKIGDKVKIIATEDSFADKYAGETGIVRCLDYGQCCGESYPHDPCIHVSGTGTWFWKEELEAINE